jgi:hypothetical protein
MQIKSDWEVFNNVDSQIFVQEFLNDYQKIKTKKRFHSIEFEKYINENKKEFTINEKQYIYDNEKEYILINKLVEHLLHY